MKFRIVVLLGMLGISGHAVAAPSSCWIVGTSTLDISSGAATSDELNTIRGKVASTAGNGPATYLKVQTVLTDANDGITNLRYTFTAAEATGGTFANTPLCADAAPQLVCGQVKLDWDPSTHGKTFWLKPIDWGWPYGKITVTPTGNGSGDSAALTIYGCIE